ncbi:MAG: hypothetical protein ACI4A3_05785 [Lachnospiraceae bacterium]
MYECPNCGGNLRFDIRSQRLACGYCNTKINPYEITKDKDAEEQNDYEVTVFTCPQCGGEIYSTDTTAAGFCSFCGASTILSSRLEREKRPAYIIPFQKTKEDCKSEYIKRVRKAVFAPKELRNPRFIESFRGIYMPYWVYHVTQQGPLFLLGKTSHRSGDYVITDHYNLTGNLDFDYSGLPYDASASFADNISERIVPFDAKRMKEFTPSFLSGFYADMADVGKDIYVEDAVNAANVQTKQYLEKDMELGHYNLGDYGNLSDKYHTQYEDAKLAMFPVWFLSYRNKDRVAYATVNGQTGKVVADLPIKISKYLIASLLLAVPIFFFLNLILTVTPSVLLVVISVIATVVLLIYEKEIKEIAAKEGYEDDKGALEGLRQKHVKRQASLEAASALEGEEPYVMTKEQLWTKEKSAKQKKKQQKGNRKGLAFEVLILGMVFVVQFRNVWLSLGVSGNITESIIMFIILIISGIIGYKGISYWKEVESGKACPGFIWTILTLTAAVLITALHPVSDIYYYGGVLGLLAAVVITLLDLIKKYNILSTRKLPQFDYRGGDDRG